MTALALEPSDTAELAAARAEVHRLRQLVEACDARHAADQAEIADHERRYSELYKRLSAVVHERDALRARVGEVVAVTRQEPALTIFCDGCNAPPLTSRALPPEDAIPGWIRGQGWTVDGDGHWCKECRPPAGQFHVERKDVRG